WWGRGNGGGGGVGTRSRPSAAPEQKVPCEPVNMTTARLPPRSSAARRPPWRRPATQARRRSRERSPPGSWLQGRPQSRCRLQDPVTVARERYDPSDEAANGFAVGAPRPAHDPDQGAVPLVEHRPAGIAIADAEAGGFAEFPRIDQAQLLGAWPVGCDQRDRTQLARGLAITLHPDTEARDNEPVAHRRRRPAVAERGGREI